jgi:hypothetical protein
MTDRLPSAHYKDCWAATISAQASGGRGNAGEHCRLGNGTGPPSDSALPTALMARAPAHPTGRPFRPTSFGLTTPVAHSQAQRVGGAGDSIPTTFSTTATLN